MTFPFASTEILTVTRTLPVMVLRADLGTSGSTWCATAPFVDVPWAGAAFAGGGVVRVVDGVAAGAVSGCGSGNVLGV